MADYIIEKLRMEMGRDERIFNFYLEMGMWLDFYAVEWFDIYLD